MKMITWIFVNKAVINNKELKKKDILHSVMIDLLLLWASLSESQPCNWAIRSSSLNNTRVNAIFATLSFYTVYLFKPPMEYIFWSELLLVYCIIFNSWFASSPQFPAGGRNRRSWSSLQWKKRVNILALILILEKMYSKEYNKRQAYSCYS
jgi:hypothetical protein